MKQYKRKQGLLIGLLLVLAHAATAQLQLSALYADSMVLQSGKPLTIQGMAAPGTKVTTLLAGVQRTAITNTKGYWKVVHPPLQPGLVGEMIIRAGSEQKVFKQVLAGEVWICSGQSNMEFTLNSFTDVYSTEMAQSADEQLRFVVVKNVVDNRERTQPELRSNWASSYPGSVGDCSAVAWFYGRALRRKLKVPVGLIISAWGGTPAQAWMDTTALQQFTDYSNLYRSNIAPINFTKLDSQRAAAEKLFQQRKTAAINTFSAMRQKHYTDDSWEATSLPGIWEDKGHPTLDGIVAYRLRFVAPSGSDTTTNILYLPAVDDIDSTYINGVLVGSHDGWNDPRIYAVPKGVVQPGVNTLTIWVDDGQGGGGLNNAPQEFYISIGGQKIMLAGPARMKILAPMDEKTQQLNGLQYQPAVLFNAMIAPLLQHAMRGVIWYQGESNADKAMEYRQLFPTLIQQWRRRWQQGPFPFLFVQLSSWNPGGNEPAISKWALLREAQANTLQLPLTGMAVTTDVGDLLDIHPKRKKEVGERLAAQAFYRVYGMEQDIVNGPQLKQVLKKGNRIELLFNTTRSGLVIKGAELKGFAIAGNDAQFYPATAVINGSKVVLSSPQVVRPCQVRYAWANAPLDANLYNAAGFPAAPFRTGQ